MGEPHLGKLAGDGGRPAAGSLRLHVGCGEQRLPGWLNVDLQPLPGVDLVADVTRGLDLPEGVAAAVFAEHFLEHLALDRAVAFLREAHRLLAPGGSIRLSTPNLDWVLATHYPAAGANAGVNASADAGAVAGVAGDRVRDGLQINRAFHGWSHRFLWNRELLAAALLACGFADLRWPEPGTSELEVFRGIDRHERYADTPAVPHVLLVEATRGEARPQELAALLARAEDEHLRFVRAASLAVDWLRSRMLARLPARGLAGWLLREHVIEGTLVGGSVKLPVEAPEAARIEITIDLRHLVVDDPACRRRLGLLPVPGAFRRRFLDRLQGPRGLDVASYPHATFVAAGAERVSPGRFAVAGEIQLRDRRAPLTLELATSETQEDWRATATFRLPLAELAFARRPAGTAPAREGETVGVELDLVAPVSAPT